MNIWKTRSPVNIAAFFPLHLFPSGKQALMIKIRGLVRRLTQFGLELEEQLWQVDTAK